MSQSIPSPNPLTFPGALALAAKEWPDKEAVVDGERRLTYRQLQEEVRRAARALVSRNIVKGDRIGIWAPNSVQWVVASLALRSAGAWLIPINTRFKADEAAVILSRARARLVFTVADFLGIDYPKLLASSDLPALQEVVVFGEETSHGATAWSTFISDAGVVHDDVMDEREASIVPEDICDVMFTSGTTGVPKGAMLRHGSSIQVMGVMADALGLTSAHRALGVNPFFHIFGLDGGILMSLIRGATLHPMPTFDVDRCLRLIAKEKISFVPGPPTLFRMLLDHPERRAFDLSCLEVAMTGSATIPPDLVVQMHDLLGFKRVATAFGLTEATGLLCITREGDSPEDVALTSGRPIDGVIMKVINETGEEQAPGIPGELLAKTPACMTGYLDDRKATAEAIDSDGFLHTGDVGYFDEKGNIHITDRTKDIFIVGGFNVYSVEVENKMRNYPGVSQVAVVGGPDHRLGSIGHAFIIPSPGTELHVEDIIAWCREHMANFKVPRHVHFVEALPTSATGKILKYQLRELATRAARDDESQQASGTK